MLNYAFWIIETPLTDSGSLWSFSGWNGSISSNGSTALNNFNFPKVSTNLKLQKTNKVLKTIK